MGYQMKGLYSLVRDMCHVFFLSVILIYLNREDLTPENLVAATLTLQKDCFLF